MSASDADLVIAYGTAERWAEPRVTTDREALLARLAALRAVADAAARLRDAVGPRAHHEAWAALAGAIDALARLDAGG